MNFNLKNGHTCFKTNDSYKNFGFYYKLNEHLMEDPMGEPGHLIAGLC